MPTDDATISFEVAPRAPETPLPVPASMASSLDVMPLAVREAVEPLLQLERLYAGYLGEPDPDHPAEPVWPRVTSRLQHSISIDHMMAEQAGVEYPGGIGGVQKLITQWRDARRRADAAMAEVRAIAEISRQQAFALHASRQIAADRMAEIEELETKLARKPWWRRGLHRTK